MRDLIDKLNKYTKSYDEGRPEITDQEWDNFYFQLMEMEKTLGVYYNDSPTQRVNYQVMNQLNKVTHNHQMLSLDKTKEWSEFTSYFSNIDATKDVLCMLKLDGLTCSLRYLDGKLVSAETRGNGEVGEEILHNALVVKSIPNRINYKDELIVDGEIICTYEDFKPFENEYKNPRNFAAGSIRLLDAKECANRNLTFVVWNVITPMTNSVMENLNEVEKLGFTITPYTSSFDWDAEEFLKNKAKELGYPIDGLVARFDDVEFGNSLGSTSHHSRAAFAYKFYDDEYETRLIRIEWSMGRTGVLTPVAVFQPIDIDGTVVERASLHNYSIMREIMGDCCYAGQKIKVYKANMIIPQISSAVKMSYGEVISNGGVSCDGLSNDYGVMCPVCGGFTSLVESDSGTVNLVCDNPECEGKLINRIDHFCGKKGLDIKGLSKATLEKLMDWGWITSIVDIYNLHTHKNDWYVKDGFGIASVDKILDTIDASRDVMEPWRVISAFGIPLIGSSASKELTKHFTVDEFVALAKDKYDFTQLDTFGDESNEAIWNFNYDEMEILLESYLVIHNQEKAQIDGSNKCYGKTFVITGSLNHYTNRDALKDVIESLGGKVSGSVSAKTECLINNDVNSNSSKNVKAKTLNIPILSEDEFIMNYIDK